MSILKFDESPLYDNTLGNMALQFRERGFATVPNVFDRDSVDDYREMILSRIVNKNNHLSIPMNNPDILDIARAPNLIRALKTVFNYDGNPAAATLFHPSWLVANADPDENEKRSGWHKDGDHDCYHSLFGYSFPRRVHIWATLEDVTIDHGPTYVIPGSHRDINKSPYNDEFQEEPLICNKENVILWDQRIWHRGSPRRIPGYRLIAIFGFMGTIPLRKRTEAQKEACRLAKSDDEKVIFGGLFANDSDG
ncbi:MAG: phytanoyl-CoA dioxygenase family protein [Lentisphaeria bacterium]|nr:phytanoyl-CoA dioxygenase family protein [Lentisphaeria bacterium]